MGRRVMEERNYCVVGHVLPMEQFRLFADLENGFDIPEFRYKELIQKAEKALETEIPMLLASDYMLFCKNGNRSIYEERCYARRNMLLDLAIGEHIENNGRFTEKLVDVLWAILEETTWTIPAHNRYRPAAVHANMPYAFGNTVDYIDLFSAATGGAVAVAYYLHKETFNSISPEINNRILYELDRQLLIPFLDDRKMLEINKWTGLAGHGVNNWCPWITTNILTVCALTVEDLSRRTTIVERALPLLDNFIAANDADGGCDEGPRYWELAGGSLWAASLVLRDLTGGYINLFDEPMLKNMGEYEVKMISAPGYLLNFADATPDYIPNPYLLYHWGITCNSKVLTDCAGWLLNENPQELETERRTPYKYLRYLTTPAWPSGKCSAPAKAYIESLQIAITRPSGQMGKGLYLAVKGGHNGESHNHNDLGNIVVYSDDQPIFVDAGTGEYTKRYFGKDRYTVWNTCSDYHNCATFNGVAQQNSKEYCTEDVVYDNDSGKLSMSLQKAYPAEAGLVGYRRSAVLTDRITITDEVEFKEPGSVMFSFITVQKPECVTVDSFTIGGRTVRFDPSLEYKLEQLDCTMEEAAPIPTYWGVDALYRITLTTKEKVTKKTFVTTVE